MSHIWKVSSLDYVVSQDGLPNVATTIHWRVSKEDANGNVGSAYGTQGLSGPSPHSFQAWENLNEAAVLAWLKNAMGAEQVKAIEDNIDAQIAEKANPTTGTGVPW